MKQDKLKNLIDSENGRIEIPEGFEDRLSDKIDKLAAEEAKASSTVKHPAVRIALRWMSLAAAVIIIAGSATWLIRHSTHDVEPKDTCANTEEAYVETQKALDMIAQSFGKGMEKVDESADIITDSRKKVETELKIRLK
ncbi:MAG: hypothetical protein LKK19_01545 [Bacteroidales bacterium]|jgi:hypothetical protein|nr:hypothetical protein [Bacteroidales bacterium]MCI2121371.1 hypothetical protein [Bacteroidales bacterium]MCI2145510.1 hypothetical protein [Bacteroidales bacterium]